MTSENILRVTIEGNVASGKSTFCQYLKQLSSEFTVVEEPLNLWRSVNGHNLFSNALGGQDLESVTNFQHFALHSVLRAHSMVSPNKVLITERCAMSQKEIFWKALSAQNLLKVETYHTLDRVMTHSDDPYNSRYPDVYIYLREKPEVCFQRCRARERFEEKDYNLTYFKLLERLHDSWLLFAVEEFDWAAKVLVIDCHGKSEKDMHSEAQKLSKTLDKLYNEKYGSGDNDLKVNF